MALKLFPFPKYREEGDKEMAEQASVEQGVESFVRMSRSAIAG